MAISSGCCELSWPSGGLEPGTPAQTPYTSAKVSQALGVATASKLGCHGGQPCLPAGAAGRQAAAASIDFNNVLAYDTPLLPENPPSALAGGRVARIPVLSGGNQNEARGFIGGRAEPSEARGRERP